MPGWRSEVKPASPPRARKNHPAMRARKLRRPARALPVTSAGSRSRTLRQFHHANCSESCQVAPEVSSGGQNRGRKSATRSSRHSLVREPFIPEPTSASTRTTCWPVAAAHPDSLATWRSRSPFWSLGGHPSVQALGRKQAARAPHREPPRSCAGSPGPGAPREYRRETSCTRSGGGSLVAVPTPYGSPRQPTLARACVLYHCLSRKQLDTVYGSAPRPATSPPPPVPVPSPLWVCLAQARVQDRPGSP